MQKILVPTDFSEFADAAKNYAITIAKKNDAELFFEHAMLVAVDWENMNEADRLLYPELKKVIDDTEKQLSELVEEVKKAGVNASYQLSFNEGLIDIPGDIKSHGYDMAVIGSHGDKGVKSALLGSNAQRMIRFAPCPVMVVKHHQSSPEFKRIAVASNFEEKIQKGLDEVIDFAKTVEAKITLLYINTPVNFETSDESYTKLNAYRERHPDIIDQVEVYNHYTEDEGIMKFMENNEADTLGIATHGRRGLTRVFSGSITESVVAHAEFPVLSVNVNT